MIKWLAFCLLAALSTGTRAEAQAMKVGPLPDGGQVVATSQLVHPAGVSIEFNGRPVDVVLSPDGKTLYAKDNAGLVVVDVDGWKIRQRMNFPKGGGSAHGIAVTRDGSRVYASGAEHTLWEAKAAPDGTLSWGGNVAIPGPEGSRSGSYICGIALSPDGKTAYVCLSRNNSLGVVDLEAGKLVKEIPVGVAPYDVVLSASGDKAYVSNWGGRHPKPGERTGESSGTKELVDERDIVCSGTVSVVDLRRGCEITEVETELHPSGMALSADGRTLYVANANSDTVSVIDTGTNHAIQTILVRPDPALGFGSAPNALALSSDGKTLYVANGGNNAIAVVDVSRGKDSAGVVRGFIPAGWYSGGIITDGKNLYIANVCGVGSRYSAPGYKGWEIHSYLGTLTKVEIPIARVLKEYTAQVRADSRVPQILQAMDKAASGKKPAPVPEHTGDPSVFEHVIYVIKENKTYDQVFGDMSQANSDPSLCIYGREVTPNHHALADQFVLLDNHYCNGVCSAEGHCWADEGNVTDYYEKAYGGWTRSYGGDCLEFSSSGPIWTHVLAHGLSFRNYGESFAEGGDGQPCPVSTWDQIYRDFTSKAGKITFTCRIPFRTLSSYSCPGYPGWNLGIPDVSRADVFLREFGDYEKKGDLPNFLIVYLPDDHTAGGTPGFPTPRAEVADNDLALGRIVEAVSKSKFWRSTCIFVNEDDPQSGFDHVDGHRSICLVVSPYTRRGALVSEFYNQTSVLHTMERMFGIPPMNQMDAMAPLMTECFTTTPDLTPYTCLPNQIPLDEMSPKTGFYYGKDSFIAEDADEKPFSLPDRIDDDMLNRVLWRLAKGPDVPYPAHFAGAHGTGLAALHLKLDNESAVTGDE